MAIINEKGNYLKITDVQIQKSRVEATIYASQESRLNGLGEFETTKEIVNTAPINIDSLANSELTIKENIITQGYVALKSLEEFATWQDA